MEDDGSYEVPIQHQQQGEIPTGHPQHSMSGPVHSPPPGYMPHSTQQYGENMNQNQPQEFYDPQQPSAISQPFGPPASQPCQGTPVMYNTQWYQAPQRPNYTPLSGHVPPQQHPLSQGPNNTLQSGHGPNNSPQSGHVPPQQHMSSQGLNYIPQGGHGPPQQHKSPQVPDYTQPKGHGQPQQQHPSSQGPDYPQPSGHCQPQQHSLSQGPDFTHPSGYVQPLQTQSSQGPDYTQPSGHGQPLQHQLSQGHDYTKPSGYGQPLQTQSSQDYTKQIHQSLAQQHLQSKGPNYPHQSGHGPLQQSSQGPNYSHQSGHGPPQQSSQGPNYTQQLGHGQIQQHPLQGPNVTPQSASGQQNWVPHGSNMPPHTSQGERQQCISQTDEGTQDTWQPPVHTAPYQQQHKGAAARPQGQHVLPNHGNRHQHWAVYPHGDTGRFPSPRFSTGLPHHVTAGEWQQQIHLSSSDPRFVSPVPVPMRQWSQGPEVCNPEFPGMLQHHPQHPINMSMPGHWTAGQMVPGFPDQRENLSGHPPYYPGSHGNSALDHHPMQSQGGQKQYTKGQKPEPAKKPVKSQSKTPAAEPQPFYDRETDEDGRVTTIKAKWKNVITKETLQLYFENRRSGGGDIADMEYFPKQKIAVIEFEDSETAARVLKKTNHKLEGENVTVTECQGGVYDKKAVFVENLSEQTSDEHLQDYLESRLKAEDNAVSEVLRGEDKGTAIVIFEENLDVSNLQTACKKKRVDGRFPTLSRVLTTSCIQISGVSTFSKDDLGYYFENKKRSGGGDIDDIDLQDDIYIIDFQEPKVAKTVCGRSHKLKGQMLTVSLYYPVLGLPQPDVLDLPPPLNIQVQDTLMTFFQKSEKYKVKLEKDLVEENAKPDWRNSKGTDLVVVCTLEQDDKPSLATVKAWPGTVEKVVKQLMSSLLVEVVQFKNADIQSGVMEELKEINIENPDDVMLVQLNTGSLSVVGEKQEVLRLKSRIFEIQSSVERKLKQENEKVDDRVNVKPSHIALLVNSDFESQLQAKYPQVTFSVQDTFIQICGNQVDINAAKLFVMETTSKFRELSFDVTESLKNLLSRTEVMNDFKQYLMSKDVAVDVCFKPDDSSFEINARTETEIKRAKQEFDKYFKGNVKTIGKDFDQFCQSQEWGSLKEKLDDEYSYNCCIQTEKESKRIVVAATRDTMENIMKSVDDCVSKFIKTHSVEMVFIPVSDGQFECIERYKNLENELLKDDSKVSIKKRNKPGHMGYELWGNRDMIRDVKSDLKEIVDNIQVDQIKIKKPGCKTYFASQNGKAEIKAIESKTSCVIHTADSNRHSEQSKRWSHGKAAQPQIHTSCHTGGVRFKIVQSDITQLDVDVIVSAANSGLKATGGIAKAIVKTGGKIIEKECQDYVSKNGKLKPGDVLKTKAGTLSCKCIMHAVTKTWEDGHSEELRSLEKTVTEILNLTEQSYRASLAFPALGSGIYKYPIELATEEIVKTIDTWLTSDENKGSSIREIYLCDVNYDAVVAFSKALVKQYGHDNVDLNPHQGHRSRSTSPGRRSNSHSSGNTYSADSDGSSPSLSDDEEPMGAKGKERHYPSRNRVRKGSSSDQLVQVKVIKEELSKMKVDIIVNSTNNTLDMKIGALSRSLLLAGGDTIQKECQQKYQNGIKLGELAVTGGGNLHCEKIYHGMIQKWDGGKGDAMKSLQNFVKLCLKKAEEFHKTSIALPAMGTGQLGYPADQVARTMFQCATAFIQNTPRPHLKKIYFVVYPEDRPTVKAFQLVENKVSIDDGVSMPTDSQTVKWGNISVTVESGDITMETTDVVVNSINESFDFSKGASSKAILAAAGRSLQQECHSKAHHMKSKGLVYTSAGNMQCKAIFHVKPPKEADDMEKVVNKCLQEADTQSYKSLSFPALGTGYQGCAPEEMAGAMFKSIHKFSNSKPSNLQEVRIIVFQREMFPVFTAAMSNPSQGFSIVSAVKGLFSRKKEEKQKPYADKAKRKQESVVFLILCESKGNIVKAKRQIQSLCEQKFGKKVINQFKDVVKQMQTHQFEHLQQTAGSSNVFISIDQAKGEITIEGPSELIVEAALSVSEYLRQFEKRKEQCEKATQIAKYVQWYYDKDGVLTKFYLDANYAIETAFKDKKKSVEIKDRQGTKYHVDLKNNEEYLVSDASKKWKIHREEQATRSGISVPNSWDKMKPDDLMISVPLQTGNKEYEKVKSEFLKSSGSNHNILQIERIQNRALYQQYAAKRAELQKKNKKEPQQWLWHGTDVDTVKKICQNGFNRSYCGKHGTAIGNGVYFAVNASYSVGGFCAVDSNGSKHIFSTQVLTGEPCQGKGGMNVLPPKAGGIHTFDSATDNLSKPSMFVIFHDSQAYPAYHITFK